MNKPIILCALAALAAFPQAQTPLTITQSAGSATGELRMQERRTNGQNYVGLKAPQSITSNITWTLPSADGTSGQALTTDGAGVLSWASASSQWTTSGTSIYYNGGPVGIGENTPAKGLLSVYGSNGSAYAPFNIVASSRFRTDANSAILLGTTSPNTSTWTRGIYWSYLSDDLGFARFKDDQTSAPIVDVYIATDGKVGIGTTTPSEVLTVTGNVDIIGGGNLRIAGTTAINSSREATFTGLTIATGAVNGYVMQTNGSGVASWAAAPACSTCLVQGGNTLGAALTIGTNDAQALRLETDAVARWQVTSAGMLAPLADDLYDIGTNSVAPNAIYSHAVSAIAASGDYVRARKFEVHMDGTGSSFFNWSFATSNTLDLLDTASGVIQRWDRNTSDVSFDAHIWPRGTTETRNLGLTTARWLAVNTKNLDLSGNVTSNLTPSGTRNLGATGSEWNGLYAGSAVITSVIEPKVNGGAQSGDTAKRWSNTYSVDGNYSGTLSTVGLTINTGAATVGYCWTATSTGGTGSWQACSGGSSLPVTDTTGISKGSSDATKILRFEVDGFTTGATRVLTPQNNSYTIAATDIAQTFSSTQTFSGTLSVSGTIGDDFVPNSDGTYVNGTTSFRWGSIATYNADFNGVLTLQSGSTFTGSILPTTNNLYALGNTSFRWSNVATVNMNLSGTITAPNGNTGLTATKTVGDGSGGSCTITISGGIITASTCP